MSALAVTAHSRASGNPDVVTDQLGPRFHGDERGGRLAISVETLRGALLWCMGFSGAFVFIEPSPYEIMGLLTMLVLALSGLSLRAAVAPLALALIIINVGYASSVVQVSDQTKPVTWVLISIFLAMTAIFYAAMLGTNPQRRLELLLRGYVLGALGASAVAVAAYFQLFGGIGAVPALRPRARHLQRSQCARGVRGAPRIADGAAHAGRTSDQRCAAAASAGSPVSLFFTRRLGPIRLRLMILSFLTSRSGTERIRIQRLYHVIYAAYVAVTAESIFIDIEHWRHYFLILGALWGLMAASRAYALERAPSRDARVRQLQSAAMS